MPIDRGHNVINCGIVKVYDFERDLRKRVTFLCTKSHVVVCFVVLRAAPAASA